MRVWTDAHTLSARPMRIGYGLFLVALTTMDASHAKEADIASPAVDRIDRKADRKMEYALRCCFCF